MYIGELGMEKIYSYDDFLGRIRNKLEHDTEFYPRTTILKEYPDGKYYEGYLWDCFMQPKQIKESELDEFILHKEEIYVFWDNHSLYRVNQENYFKYGRKVILIMSGNEFMKIKEELPEDVYITDREINFLVAYTHEWCSFTKGEILEERYCLVNDNQTLL